MRRKWMLGIAGIVLAGTLSLSAPEPVEAAAVMEAGAVQSVLTSEVRLDLSDVRIGFEAKKNQTTTASKKTTTSKTKKKTTTSKAKKNGWVPSGDKYYYYKNGVKQTGWKEIKGKRYYFNAKGVMQTEWTKVGKNWYYLGQNGVAQTGWKKIDGSWFYFSKKGVAQVGWRKIGKKWYYFDEKGTMVIGQKVIQGKLHDFKTNGEWIGEVQTSGSSGKGQKTYQGRTYNAAAAIKFAISHTKVDVDKGLARDQCVNGWQCAEFVSNCLKVGGMPEYNDHASALHNMLAADPAIQEIVIPMDSAGYIRLENVKGGEIAAGDPILLYCPNETDGKPFVHTLLFVGWDENGCAKIYCHNNRNVGVVNRWPACYACGHHLTEAHAMHIKMNSPKENNTYPKNSWMHVGDQYYHINSQGVKDTGLITLGKNKFYLNKKGVMQTGWQQIDGTWYYFDTSGKMVRGWLKVNEKWYYFKNGAMVTGWRKIDGKKYYFSKNGVMQTGWLKVKNKTYYLHAKGHMAVGWRKINGKKYYFDANGVMQTGRVKIKGRYYKFGKTGVYQGKTK